jgi:hypothetical protein
MGAKPIWRSFFDGFKKIEAVTAFACAVVHPSIHRWPPAKIEKEGERSSSLNGDRTQQGSLT